MNINLEELCFAVKGDVANPPGLGSIKLIFKGVSIDSRESNLNGKIFFAIKGEQFDGHDFLRQAVEGGAKALVVHKDVSINNIPIIKVADSLKALQDLAFYWREKIGVLVIGITGSAGKTTTKHFCHTLLQKAKKTVASPKSFNNRYGVPLTLLSAEEGTDIVIQEIGMNQKGEIKALCQIAKPDIVTITQIGESHIGKLGGQDAIAKEKEQIYIHSPKALKVFNKCDPYTLTMYKKRKLYGPGNSLCVSSQGKTADVFLQIKEIKKQSLIVSGHIQGVEGGASVPVAGPIHLGNLMSAVGLALFAGLKPDQIWERLSFCRLPSGRNQWVKLSSGAQALFDAYNASPESVMALLEYFLSPVVEGKKILILGDFLELGSYLEVLQNKIAKKLAENDLYLVWFIGSQAESFKKALKSVGCSVEFYCSQEVDSAIAKKILSQLDSSTALAFKASRRMQLEKVLQIFNPLNFSF